MPRILRHEIIGFRCELKRCTAKVDAFPTLPADSTWHDQISQLAKLVDAGWALVLHAQLRTYCPEHAALASTCKCIDRSRPERKDRCPVHSEEMRAMVWDAAQTPVDVLIFQEMAS